MTLRNKQISNLHEAQAYIDSLQSELLNALCVTDLNGYIASIEINDSTLVIGGSINHPMCLYDGFELYFVLEPNLEFISDFEDLEFKQRIEIWSTSEPGVCAFSFSVDLVDMLQSFRNFCVFDFKMIGVVGKFSNSTAFGKYREFGSWNILKKYSFRDGIYDVRIEKYQDDQLKVTKLKHDPLWRFKHSILYIYRKIFK